MFSSRKCLTFDSFFVHQAFTEVWGRCIEATVAGTETNAGSDHVHDVREQCTVGAEPKALGSSAHAKYQPFLSYSAFLLKSDTVRVTHLIDFTQTQLDIDLVNMHMKQTSSQKVKKVDLHSLLGQFSKIKSSLFSGLRLSVGMDTP